MQPQKRPCTKRWRIVRTEIVVIHCLLFRVGRGGLHAAPEAALHQ